MKQLTGSCFSWWRDSRNNRIQSSWLQTTLEEMDQKTQIMLNLLESKADSFAQRADFFYLKRPQLINMIEEYYRAYRSLAEQFDRLKGQIGQNFPESVQDFTGLSCDSPLESPLEKKISVNGNLKEGFKEFLRSQERCGSASEEVSEVGDPVNCNTRSKRPSDQESVNMIPSDQESGSALSYSDSEMASHFGKPTETENIGSMTREMQIKMEDENSLLLKQLAAKNIQVDHLKIKNKKLEEKAYCKEEMSLVMQNRSVLQKELEIIKVENTKLRNENRNEVNVWKINDLKELYFIRKENTKLRNENEINVKRLQILTKKVRNLQKENKSYKIMALALACVNERLRKEMCGANQESEVTVRSLKDEKKKVEVILEAKENLVLEQSFKIKESQNEVCDRNSELDVIKAEGTKMRNGNEVNAQRVQELMNENEINGKKLQVVTEIGRGNRHGKGEANIQVQVQVLSEKVRRLEKENTNKSKQNKIMSIVLAYVNSQAAKLEASNARAHDEICGGNCQSIDTVQILEDEKKNVEITVEAKKLSLSDQNFRIEKLKRQVSGLVTENAILRNEIEVNVQSLQVPQGNGSNLQSENARLCTQGKNVKIILEANEKLVMEQSLRIGVLQKEVYQLLDENRVQEIKLHERNEKTREAVRQICFTLDALMDKNKRLQKALQILREEGECKPNNIEISTSQISRWRKFLYARRRIMHC